MPGLTDQNEYRFSRIISCETSALTSGCFSPLLPLCSLSPARMSRVWFSHARDHEHESLPCAPRLERVVGDLSASCLPRVFCSLAGGGIGVLVAAWALRGIAQLPGMELPRLEEIRLDGAVLGFAILLSTATGLLFGLAPSL